MHLKNHEALQCLSPINGVSYCIWLSLALIAYLLHLFFQVLLVPKRTVMKSFTRSFLFYYLQAGLSLMKPMMPGIASENQDQPSPISVLEPPFEEDDNITRESSSFVKPADQGNIPFSSASHTGFFYDC